MLKLSTSKLLPAGSKLLPQMISVSDCAVWQWANDAPYNVSVDAVTAIVQQHYLLEMIIIQRYDYTPCHVRKPLG